MCVGGEGAIIKSRPSSQAITKAAESSNGNANSQTALQLRKQFKQEQASEQK